MKNVQESKRVAVLAIALSAEHAIVAPVTPKLCRWENLPTALFTTFYSYKTIVTAEASQFVQRSSYC
jgi:hypothetical protein